MTRAEDTLAIVRQVMRNKTSGNMLRAELIGTITAVTEGSTAEYQGALIGNAITRWAADRERQLATVFLHLLEDAAEFGVDEALRRAQEGT